MRCSTLCSVITYMILFVIAAAIMKNALDVPGDQAFGFTIAIMVLAIIGDTIRKRSEHNGQLSQQAQAQVQADINELRKSVAEIREYVTDLYIQRHDEKFGKSIN